MRHLILGCGYLGERVARLWLGQGDEVFANTRKPETAARFRALRIEPIVCDVLDPSPLKDLPPFDTILYAIGWDRSAGTPMREVYVDGLERVLRATTRPAKWIHISSTSVYGQTDGSWVDEESPTKPAEESGQIVLAAEETLRSHIPDAIVLRFAGIYGPGRLLRQKAIESGMTILAEPDRWLNVIQVEDGARAVVAAGAQAPPGMVVNVCDGHPVTRRDFFAELAQMLHAPEPKFETPAPGQPTPPHEHANRRLGNRRLREELQMEPRFPDYRAGLRGSIPQ